MKKEKLIGMRVMNMNTHMTGIIEYIQDGCVAVNQHGNLVRYSYPAAFSGILELEDEFLQQEIKKKGTESSFEMVKRNFKFAINNEIEFLKSTGGKRYRIIDGERSTLSNGEYLYIFETDMELHFPDGTAIKIWFPDKIVMGCIVACEDFTVLIRTMQDLGKYVESVEFTSEQWQLLECLVDRINEMHPETNSLAYEVACNGRSQITQWQTIKCGQGLALNRATSEEITFIWGPPGTGKTETLADIALMHIEQGKRVLMLSYSNVSVDGALLRIAKKADLLPGTIIRYGYPRTKELLENKTLTSYQYVLSKNPEKAAEYHELVEAKKKLKRDDPERIEINKQIGRIRNEILEKEKILVHKAEFVATTVSKATMDKAIYEQKFDVVIFDEASMAYVPQIIFAAGLAKSYFICLGDFCQLPAIVQNPMENRLTRDIFEYTGITSAVENNRGHEWLVMLNLQYRMHQDIADFVSERMYQGRLKTSEKISESRDEMAACHPCLNSAMSLVDLSGMYSVCTKTMDNSRINIWSALMCLRLTEKNIDQYEVGIITPYSAQARLILAMLRDIREHDPKWMKVTCATVHQFQGSEKPIIIYDAVDCFRMQYPGMLLTSSKNNTANRLFNVALTRAKGKFILVANTDFLERKNISKNLVFTQAMKLLKKEKNSIIGNDILDEMMPTTGENPLVYMEDRERSWKKFIEDIKRAKNVIHIDIPDVLVENDKALETLGKILKERKKAGVEICIRLSEDIDLPKDFQKYINRFEYVSNPITVIDKKIIWFGQPLYAADFISEGNIIETEYFPCARFEGTHAARSIKAFLEM